MLFRSAFSHFKAFSTKSLSWLTQNPIDFVRGVSLIDFGKAGREKAEVNVHFRRCRTRSVESGPLDCGKQFNAERNVCYLVQPVFKAFSSCYAQNSVMGLRTQIAPPAKVLEERLLLLKGKAFFFAFEILNADDET